MTETNTRRITFPEPCIPSIENVFDKEGKIIGAQVTAKMVGLVEWICDSFTRKGVLDTIEGVDLVQALLPRLDGLKGPKQTGKTFDLTEGQWEHLKKVATPQGDTGPVFVLGVATCMGALYRAEIVKDEPKPAKTTGGKKA